MTPPKILILDHFNCHGGSQEYAIDIANKINHLGHTVYIPLIEHPSLNNLAKNIPKTNFPILAQNPRSIVFWFRFFLNIFQIRNFLSQKKINIIHCNSIPVLLLAKIARKKQPIVFAYHISHPNIIKQLIIRFCAEYFIYVSKSMKLEADTFNIYKPFKIIYNGIFDIPHEKSLIRAAIPIRFCIPGRITHSKGIHLFIEAALIVLQKYPDSKFTIIGQAESKQYLQKVLHRIEHTPSIQLTPFIIDKSKIYLEHDIIVNSTIINEPLGRTLIEAGLFSKACIAPNNGGPTEIVEHQTSGLLFENNNVLDLAEKMFFFIENPEKISEFGKNGRKIFEQKFSIQSIVQEIINYYSEIIVENEKN